MSVEQLESAILALAVEVRRRMAVWFEEHRHELFGDDANEEVTDEQRAEVLRRRDLALAHPELLEPWERRDRAGAPSTP